MVVVSAASVIQHRELRGPQTIESRFCDSRVDIQGRLIMSSYDYEMTSHDPFAMDAAADERAAFIRKTYLTLVGAIGLFGALEATFLSSEVMRNAVFQMIGPNWWLALIGYMVVSWVAHKWAQSGASATVQYAGLGLYALAEAVIFMPILMIASMKSPQIVPAAGLITLLTFGGLSGIVMLTKADFSFLRTGLVVMSFLSFGLVLASVLFGFSLGIVYCGAMIALMAGWILYDTSNVLHHYRTDQHAAAALALFSSLSTLFWYVIRLFIAMQSDD